MGAGCESPPAEWPPVAIPSEKTRMLSAVRGLWLHHHSNAQGCCGSLITAAVPCDPADSLEQSGRGTSVPKAAPAAGAPPPSTPQRIAASLHSLAHPLRLQTPNAALSPSMQASSGSFHRKADPKPYFTAQAGAEDRRSLWEDDRTKEANSRSAPSGTSASPGARGSPLGAPCA